MFPSICLRYEWKDDREIDIIDIEKGMQLCQDGIPVAPQEDADENVPEGGEDFQSKAVEE